MPTYLGEKLIEFCGQPSYKIREWADKNNPQEDAYPTWRFATNFPLLISIKQNLYGTKRMMFFDKFGFTLWFVLRVCSLFFLCLLHSPAPSLISDSIFLMFSLFSVIVSTLHVRSLSRNILDRWWFRKPCLHRRKSGTILTRWPWI